MLLLWLQPSTFPLLSFALIATYPGAECVCACALAGGGEAAGIERADASPGSSHLDRLRLLQPAFQHGRGDHGAPAVPHAPRSLP